MYVSTVTSPFEVPLDALDVVDINAVRFDPNSLNVVLRDAAGEATTSAALAASLHGSLMDGIRAASLFIVGEVTARLRVKGSESDGDWSSSVSISAWSSGAPGSTESSCSSSGAKANDVYEGYHPQGAGVGCAPDDAGADADVSGSSSGSSSNDRRRMRFERLGYGVPEADRAADEFARDGAPSCRLYIAQRGHIIASSVDVASYEPVFLTDADVSPSHPVTLLVSLGGSTLDARDLLPPRTRYKGTILETTIDPNHFDDGDEKTVTLLQTHPLVDAAWNSACIRLRVGHSDAFCADLHVIGASGLPRRGVTHEVFRYLAPVFALVMQTNVEMTAAARALTDQWTEQKKIESELRSQVMNPSLSAFMANRSQNAVVNVTLAASDFLFPEALDMSRETLEAMMAARRSECSQSTSEPSDRSGSDHGHCSRSTSSSSGASDASGPTTTSSSANSSSSGACSRSTSEGGVTLLRRRKMITDNRGRLCQGL